MMATTVRAGGAGAAARRGLRASFRGALLAPGEEGYDEARHVWNGAIDRRPALIARCAGADDVVVAVRFAADAGMPLSVRGGGHSVAGHGVCEGGLMIDLSLMKAIRVDPAARAARAAGGVLWGEFDRATQRHGLAVTGGMISHTGVGGLTLGGGLGNLMRKLGLTVDSLTGVHLVTAAGERLHVTAESDPELFWGLRGGGGNFGIATALEYRLHPVGPMVVGGPMLWPLDDAPAVLPVLDELAGGAPDELGIALFARLAPPMPFVPPDRVGTPVVLMLVVWCGAPGDLEPVLAPLRAAAAPLVDLVRPVPYLALQSLGDGGAPPGNHYYWRSHRLPGLGAGAIDAIVEMTGAITSPMSQVGGWIIGGAASRVPADATAVGPREPGVELNVTAAWSPADDGERHRAWVRRGWESLRPYSAGVYANFLSDEDAAAVRASYGERLARLTALKDRHDPGNAFRLNANVAPTGGAR